MPPTLAGKAQVLLKLIKIHRPCRNNGPSPTAAPLASCPKPAQDRDSGEGQRVTHRGNTKLFWSTDPCAQNTHGHLPYPRITPTRWEAESTLVGPPRPEKGCQPDGNAEDKKLLAEWGRPPPPETRNQAGTPPWESPHPREGLTLTSPPPGLARLHSPAAAPSFQESAAGPHQQLTGPLP